MKKQVLSIFLFVIIVFASGNFRTVFAQAETLSKGRSIFSVFYTRSDTETRFDFLGERVRVIPAAGPDFRGSTRSDIISFDYAYGITDRLEIHVTVPYADIEFASIDRNGTKVKEFSPSEAAISNTRFGLRYNLVRKDNFFVTAKFDVKAPASSSELQRGLSGTTLPIDEGQTDFDITGQVSRRFIVGNRLLRVGAEAGIRLRREQSDGATDAFTNETLPVDPANEFIYNFQVNYSLLRRLSLGLVGNGIEQGDFRVPFRTIRVGNDGEVKTVGTQGSLPPGFKPDFEKQSGRRIFSLGPIANLSVTAKTTFTAGVLFTVSGRNFPAGQYLVFGVSRVF
ncbi:MAG: hypothetical protein JNN15_07100 [Blastocatellia bacterium]|nr:hypothetical protein [Blastocatellia bacterium]